jgi:hypothetical protein
VKIGIATSDTTPEPGTYLGGFARLRDCNGVRDRLRVTCVWFQRETAVLLVCADLVFIHRGLSSNLRRSVRQRFGNVEVVVACSHSHSTPYGTDEAPERRFQAYSEQWVQAALASAAEAKASARAGRIRYREATPHIAVNRRLPGADGQVDFGWNEEGLHDNTAQIVEFVSEDDRCFGCMVNIACHPTTLPPWSRRASADWVGAMRRRVESETGVPCAFIQGACADLNPRHEWVPKSGRLTDTPERYAAADNDSACDAIGHRAADSVLRALGSRGSEWIPTGSVVAKQCHIPLRIEPSADFGSRYWRGLAGGKPLPKFFADALLNRAFPWTTRVQESGGASAIELDITAVRIGGLAICGHGSEPFVETGLAVKSASPAPFTLFAGYTNGMIGYVPTAEAVPRGGYEVELAPCLYRLPGRFAADSSQRAVDGSIELLAALWAND